MVAGVLLLMWGRNLAYTFTGKAQYLLTGSPGEKPVTLFAIGAGLALIGMYQVFWIRR